MNTNPVNSSTSVQPRDSTADSVVSLSQRATQATNSASPNADVSSTKPSTTSSASAAGTKPQDQACLDEIYQWLVTNHDKLSGSQSQRLINDLIDKLNSAKTPDNKLVYKNMPEMTSYALTGLQERFNSAGDPQKDFFNRLSANFLARSLVLQNLMKSAFFDEVKSWYDE